MISKSGFTAIAIGIVVCLATSAPTWAEPEDVAQNWHRFRGPEATGIAPEGNPPITWDETTNIKWKVEIPGRGQASPVIWGDKIFVATAIKIEEPAAAETDIIQANFEDDAADSTDSAVQPQQQQGSSGRGGGKYGGGTAPSDKYQFVILCLDRHDGSEIWRRTAAESVPHEGHHETGSYASASPVTNGEHLFVSFGSNGIFCYDLDGNQQWSRDLGEMEIMFGFGEGASPALYGDNLIINWDHQGDSFITVLNTADGSEKWRKERDEPTNWVTPLVVEHGELNQVVVNGKNRAIAYDLSTGDIIWECGGQVSSSIPTPVRHGDLVFCMTGFRGHVLYAIPLEARGDITPADVADDTEATDTDGGESSEQSIPSSGEVAWERHTSTPYISSPILYEDLLYFTKGRDAILTCVDAATGEEHYVEERLTDMEEMYASPVGADGRIYLCDRDGTCVVVEHGPTFEEMAVNQLDEPIDATPAIVGNRLYIRGEQHLYCIEETRPY